MVLKSLFFLIVECEEQLKILKCSNKVLEEIDMMTRNEQAQWEGLLKYLFCELLGENTHQILTRIEAW